MDPMRYAIRFGVLEDGLGYACENFTLFESAFRYVLRLRDYPPTSFPIRFGWDGKPKHPITRDLGLAKFNDYNRNLKGALDSPEFNGRRV